MRLAITICLVAFLLQPVLAQKSSKKPTTNKKSKGSITIATPDSLAWQAGGSEADLAYGIAVDSYGNAFVCGSFQESAVFGDTVLVSRGNQDVFLAKYDAGGKLQWVRQAGSGHQDFAKALTLDARGNVYIVGVFQDSSIFGINLPDDKDTLESKGIQGAFVARYSTEGQLDWMHQIGDSGSSFAESVVIDNAGDVYITGGSSVAIDSQVLLDKIARSDTNDLLQNLMKLVSNDKAFLAKYNSEGVLQWLHTVEGTGYSFGSSVSVDSKRNTYVTGNFSETIRLGDSTFVAKGEGDSFLVKYNSVGELQWAIQAAGMINVDTQGNVFVVGCHADNDTTFFGSSRGSINGAFVTFIAKIDTMGTFQWIRKILPSCPMAYGSGSFAMDISGNMYIVSHIYNSVIIDGVKMASRGEYDVLLIKYNNQGTLMWVRQDGDVGNEHPIGLTIGPDGAIWVTGSFQGKTTLAGHTFTPKGGEDVFVVKYPKQ